MSDRTAAVTRETAETTVEVTLDIDGDGESTTDTGIGFFDHMLDAFATHGLFDMTVRVDGDLDVDAHHTVEDAGIALGSAFADALGDKHGIVRFSDRRLPLDEAVASVVLDVSGRSFYAFDGEFSAVEVGSMSSGMARHFFRSFAMNAGVTLHIEIMGDDAHHEIEAMFKAVARALDDATQIDSRRPGLPSTKDEL